MIRALFILLALTTSVSAGPWPRAEDEGFVSFSLDLDVQEFDNNFVSSYLEYGIGRDRTLIIDRQQSGDMLGKTFVALRFPVGRPERQLKLAYDVGLGVVEDNAAVRFGLSIGRGWSIGQDIREKPFQWKGQWSGWWSVDTRTLVFRDGVNGIFETDITFGAQLTPRLKSISQVQTGAPFDGNAFAKFAQSFAYQMSEKRHYVLGITHGIHDVDVLQVNLGFWQDF